MAPPSYDVVIVGAGIIGCACARELAEAGLAVAVYETGSCVAAGATGAAMGHLAVMDDSEAQFALTSYSQRLWRELAPELPPPAEYQPCGALWVAADAGEFEEAERKYRFYTERNVPAEILSGDDLLRAEPNLRPGLAGALRLPADAVCDPGAAARYFAERAQVRGAQFMFGARVANLLPAGVGLANGEAIQAKHVVLASGVSVGALAPELDVRPRKGHLLLTDRYPGFLRHQVLELGYLKSAHALTADSVAFVAQPRASGEIVLGSSRQFGNVDPAPDPEILRQIGVRAREFMPGIEKLSITRAWTGFRPATPGKLPLIGPLPNRENVYVAAGHEGLGISTSLATGRLLADEILRRRSEIDRSPYSPLRTPALSA